MNHKQKLEAEKAAITYARWLAKRDGIDIAEKCSATAIWGTCEHIELVNFYSPPTGEVTIKIPNWDWKPSKIAA